MAQNTPLTEKQQFWLEHVKACNATGVSMRNYAEANDLNVRDFYSWKKTLRSKGLIKPASSSRQPLFHKAQVLSTPRGRCRIIHPSGIAVEFDAGTDPDWLAQLLSALP